MKKYIFIKCKDKFGSYYAIIDEVLQKPISSGFEKLSDAKRYLRSYKKETFK